MSTRKSPPHLSRVASQGSSDLPVCFLDCSLSPEYGGMLLFHIVRKVGRIAHVICFNRAQKHRLEI